MNKNMVFVVAAFIAGSAFSQQPLPINIIPLDGEVSLRFNSSFYSQCTQKSSVGRSRESLGNTKTSDAAFGIFEQYGRTKLVMNFDAGTHLLSFVLNVNDDGSGFMAGDPEARTNLPTNEDDKKELLEGAKDVMGPVKKSLLAVIGTPLRQGQELKRDICEDIFRLKGPSILARVRGFAAIRGRESLILETDQSYTCTAADGEWRFQIKGWQAIDRQSGLPAGQSFAHSLELPGKSRTFSSEDRECEITGEAIKALPN